LQPWAPSKKDTDFTLEQNKLLLKRILRKKNTHNKKLHQNNDPTVQDPQVTKRIQVQTSKAGEKEDYFFHLSLKCQNVISTLPALRKPKEDYQAIKPFSGSFVV